MKKLLKFFSTLIAIVVIAAVTVPMFISADFIKAQLAAQVKKATGRELVIKGDASIKLLPNIAVQVSDVTLGNPAGFKSDYLVHIGTLVTGAELKPLLNKELRITGVMLDGADINLEETASGAKNWEFAPAKKAEASPYDATANEAKQPALKQFAIGKVTIKHSVVRYAKAGEKPMALEDIAFDLEGADGVGALKLDGSAVLREKKIAVELDIASLKKFMAGTLVATKLAVTLPQAKLSFAGDAGAKGAEYGAMGKLDVAIEDVSKLQSWATGKAAKPAFPRSVTIASTIKASGVNKTVTLDALKAQLDALVATGKLTVAYGGAVPAINGALMIPALDLDAMTGGEKATAATSAPAAAKNEGWSDAPIDASGLRAANAKLKLDVGQLKTGNVTIADMAMDVALDGGKLTLGLGHAALYGGSAKGTVKLDGSGAGVGLNANLALAGIDMDALMTAMSGASKLKGKATLGLDVNGRGVSQRAIVGTLNGQGTMRIMDGAIKGINIASFLRDAKKGFIMGSSSTEATDFTEMTASYRIVNGVVSNDDLAMKSPVLRLSGKGVVNLPPRTINYRAVPAIVGTLKGQGGKDKFGDGLAVPLLITGPWSKISVTPDVAGMLNEAIKNPEALKQNLKDIKSNMGDFNSPKDIGKALFGGKKKEAPAAEPVAEPAAATDAAAPAAEPAPAPKKEKGLGGLLKSLEQ